MSGENPTGLLTRRVGVDRERMHAAGEFAGKRRVDHAVALDPGLPPEGIRHNIDPEMRLPAGPMAGMAFMLMGLVDHAQALPARKPWSTSP